MLFFTFVIAKKQTYETVYLFHPIIDFFWLL